MKVHSKKFDSLIIESTMKLATHYPEENRVHSIDLKMVIHHLDYTISFNPPGIFKKIMYCCEIG